MNKPNAVCIFAHPDDESFGPSGTIYKLTHDYNVYIICVTKGDAGENHHEDKETPLSELRKKELESSSKILGVTKVFFLGYEDGELKNNNYHEVAADAQKILDDLRPELVLTMEHWGVSGHLDHIAVAMITSYLYEKLSYIKTAMFYGLTKEQVHFEPGEYFIYFPRGRYKERFNLYNDVSGYLDIKKKAMAQHLSQAKDLKRIMRNIKTVEYFYTFERT